MISKIFNYIKNRYFLYRLNSASSNQRAELMRGKCYYLGKNVKLYTTSFGTEPYLIRIYDNVTCASHVRFITHDVSCFNMARFAHIDESQIDKVGSITLFENAFVGAYAILMPNTSVGKNSVVAAGSIVTKHIPDGQLWGGVPAKYIMETSEYSKKIISQSKAFPWINQKRNFTNEELVKMRQDYFFK